MNLLHKSLRLFYIYLGILLFSISVFYAVDGKFETDIISFPTLWTDWFYFLYVVLPFFIFVRLIYRVWIKKIPYTQSLNSVVFIVALSVVQILYWFAVDSYKKLLFYDVQAIEAKLTKEVNSVELANINARFELNKFNKNRSYKLSFSTLSKPTYKTDINIRGYVVGTNKRVSSRTLSLLTNKLNQNHYFYISEKYFRDEITSNDTLDFKISYSVDFPRKKYKPKAELAQQLCTWSFIECSKTENEVAWHDTELFDSTIFQLPYKINSSEKPLTQVKLNGFTNLDLLLPFTDISFLSEETTTKHGFIEKFDLKFEVNSRIDGYIYSQISSAKHSGHLANMPLEHKSTISKGKNIITIPIDINELSTLMNKQTESSTIEFDLFISNNRSWYCPDFVCEINNHPSQFKHFVVTTKSRYHTESFPEMKPGKRVVIYPNSGRRGDY